MHNRQRADILDVPARRCEADRFRGCSWNVQCSVAAFISLVWAVRREALESCLLHLLCLSSVRCWRIFGLFGLWETLLAQMHCGFSAPDFRTLVRCKHGLPLT